MIHPSEEILLGSCPPPRSPLTPPKSPFNTADHRTMSPSLSTNAEGVKLWGNLFHEINRLPINEKKNRGYFEFSSAENRNNLGGLQLNAIDLKHDKNHKVDHDVKGEDAETILKRSKSFEFDLTFNCPFDISLHRADVVFEKENAKKHDDRERFVIKLGDTTDKLVNVDKNWTKEVAMSDSNVSIKIHVSPRALCGTWQIIVTIPLIGNTNSTKESSNAVYTVSGIHIVE